VYQQQVLQLVLQLDLQLDHQLDLLSLHHLQPQRLRRKKKKLLRQLHLQKLNQRRNLLRNIMKNILRENMQKVLPAVTNSLNKAVTRIESTLTASSQLQVQLMVIPELPSEEDHLLCIKMSIQSQNVNLVMLLQMALMHSAQLFILKTTRKNKFTKRIKIFVSSVTIHHHLKQRFMVFTT
jgi:hypothetical protein